jgi:lon-related putative ATP-dependent protease
MKQTRRTPARTASQSRRPRGGSARFAVPTKALRWVCTPAALGISSMGDVRPLREIIGQDRALRALQVGMEMRHYGYNIFVTGLPGTGKTATIKRMLLEAARRHVDLTDKCYLHNFRDPDAPVAVMVPAGQGAQLKQDMASLLAELQKSIPAVFESRRYIEQRKATLDHFQERQRSVLKDFEKKVKSKGFEVVQVQGAASTRPEIAPVVEGNPVGLDQMHARAESGEITRDELQAVLAQHADLEAQMDRVMREMRNIERRAKKSIEDLNHKIVVPVVEELLQDIRTRYPNDRLQEFLVELEKNIVDNLSRFQQREEQPSSMLGIQLPKEEDTFIEFEVNVIVDNSTEQGVPVIMERNPRYKNIFGTIERVVDRNGVWRTDFTRIKAGSLLKADGGYLVLDALDALTEPGVWTMLKRVLRNREIEIQPIEIGLLGGTSALKPEPIKLNVKVIMIGDPYIYHLLYGMDEDFREIFKIRADFDSEMPNNPTSIQSYLSFIKALCDQEHLLSFDMAAVAEVIEYGVRLSGRQNKLSTRFSILADVLREASYWTARDGAASVTRTHVRKAIDERIERVRLVEEKIQEMIDDGSIMIDTQGSVIGQVNGLSVYNMGEYEFGKPSRITAKTSMGKAGIINIERESAMSGPSHNKGVLILSGFLRSIFAQHHPLDLSASIAFEQSYSGVDGDSASSTEVYAVLSSLSDLPLRQDLAVTGSVNQHGEIQPIGGVNLKIEGFFDVCHARGLTGTQGVLIPKQNIQDLMLRHDVVDAVRAGKFYIYAVGTIAEGIELLTGRPAGQRTRTGFTPKSVYALVDERLKHFARAGKKQDKK